MREGNTSSVAGSLFLSSLKTTLDQGTSTSRERYINHPIIIERFQCDCGPTHTYRHVANMAKNKC